MVNIKKLTNKLKGNILSYSEDVIKIKRNILSIINFGSYFWYRGWYLKSLLRKRRSSETFASVLCNWSHPIVLNILFQYNIRHDLAKLIKNKTCFARSHFLSEDLTSTGSKFFYINTYFYTNSLNSVTCSGCICTRIKPKAFE